MKKIIYMAILMVLVSSLVLATNVTRTLPAIASPNSNITVYLTVNLSQGDTYYIIRENVPLGWQIVSASDQGDYTTVPGRIDWVVFTGAVSKTINYSVTTTSSPGNYLFNGTYGSETKSETVIEGNKSINVTSAICNPNWVNTTNTTWGNLNCVSNQRNQSVMFIEYDANHCPTSINITHYNYRLVGPTYNLISSSNWYNISSCINGNVTQAMNFTYSDIYGCSVNILNQSYRNTSCNIICTPHYVNSTNSTWNNLSCSGNQMNQSSIFIEYDSNFCLGSLNITHYNYRLIGPTYVLFSSTNWYNASNCIDGNMTQAMNFTYKDNYLCSAIIFNQSIRTVSCTVTPCSQSWIASYGSCQTNNLMLKTHVDSNNCNNNTGKPADEYVSCDYCVSDWDSVSGACQTDNTKTITYHYTNNCCSTTGLPSDCDIPANEVVSCNYTAAKDNFVVDYIKVSAGGKSGSELTNGKTIKGKATPESEVIVKIKMLNEYSEDDNVDIDVDGTVTIKDIDDGDDLEEEDSTTIESDDKETMEFTFKIPKEVEEKTYEMEILLEADDDNGREYDKTYNLKLKVDKEDHLIEIEKADLEPKSISCSDGSTLSVSILNMGSKEEKKVRLTVFNSRLGINLDKMLDLEEAPDRSARFKTDIPIDTTGLPEGQYSIPVNVYYNQDTLSDSKNAILTVAPCISQEAIPVPNIVSTPENAVVVIMPPETPMPTVQPKQKVKYCCDKWFGMCLQYCYKWV